MSFAPASTLLAALVMLAAGGTALAETADQATNGTFGAAALITTDAAWRDALLQAGWPDYEKSEFVAGESGTLALVFADAEARNGEVNIVCDVTMYEANFEKVLAEGATCYKGPPARPGMATPVVIDWTFTVTLADVLGEVGFRINVKDMHSGRAVPLNVTYTRGPLQ